MRLNCWDRNFNSIVLDADKYRDKGRNDFISKLKADLVGHRHERQKFYRDRRGETSPVKLLKVLTWTAVVASISSAVAAGFRGATFTLGAGPARSAQTTQRPWPSHRH